ncbi:MAG: glycosyltransferase [Thermoanaerobaculia bacterium]
MREGQRPVFFDPHQRRWRRFRVVAGAAGALFVVAAGALVASVLVNPVLPRLGLPAVGLPAGSHHAVARAPEPFVGTAERRFREARRRLEEEARKRRPMAPPARRAGKSELVGFYVNWDDTSYTSLKQNIGRIDRLVPEWLHLGADAGALVVDDPPRLRLALDLVREVRPGLPITPLVNNFESSTVTWQGGRLGRMLADPAARARVIEGLLRYVRGGRFQGVSLDFEALPAGSGPRYGQFLEEVAAAFHPHGLTVSVSMPMDDDTFPYAAAARACDELYLMAYDEHSGEGEAGPVSSIGWFSRTLKRRLATLPAEKVVVALGSYGYDWKEGERNGNEVSFQEAVRTAQESEGVIALDAESLNPTFDYADENDRVHHVWFLDAVSAFDQIREADSLGPKGYALWRLGSEDPSLWTVLDHRDALDGEVAARLRAVRYGYDIDYQGVGEVLHVAETPKEGVREIGFDAASGRILTERVVSFPSPFVIERRGGLSPKKVVLTFDDGPDPRWTPQILDILAREKAPAVFFLIGINADLEPRLLSRIRREGHEIGNHTFSHPNISTIGGAQFRFEMNATERLLESRLGVSTLLFRPPYAEDVEPETPDQVVPLLAASSRGYYTIGMKIDPGDWRSPGVERIVDETLRAAKAGEGNVVLLHDGGGDRSQTIAALPLLIESLRREGFEIVSLSNLLGLAPDALMPPVPRSEKLSLLFSDAGFLLISGVGATLGLLFLAGIALGTARLLVIGVLAVVQKVRRPPWRGLPRPELTVTVLVPAWNEAKVVVRTVETLLASTGPAFDVVVVDDGSTDGTYEAVVGKFAGEPRVRVFRQANAGKAAALNHAISRTEADVVIGLDADTLFRPATISALLEPFADPSVGAVAGNAKVGNRINLLTRWQAIEYITSQNLERRAFDVLNGITVVPGAVGAWRRSLVLEAGGFPSDTLAEDADLTLAILRGGHRVRYAEDAVAYTEAPDTLAGFMKQRFRWLYGTMQAAWKARGAFFSTRAGGLGFFALPNLLVFQVLFPLVSPFVDLQVVFAVALAAWRVTQHPDAGLLDSGLGGTLLYYALFMGVDLLVVLVSFLLERREDWTILRSVLLQRLVYRQLMYYVSIRSLLTAIRGSVVGWGKLERKATVT